MDIEQRLAKLEKESRTWRFVALCFAIAAGVALSYSFGSRGRMVQSALAADEQAADATFKTIRVQDITIVNKRGERMATLGAPDDNEASLLIWNPDDELQCVSIHPTGISAGDGSNEAFFKPGLIGTGKRKGELVRDCREAYAKLKRAKASNDLATAQALWDDAKQKHVKVLTAEVTNTIVMGEGEAGGGILNVYNGIGKCVASVASGKTNEGMIGVNDVNGQIKSGLTTEGVFHPAAP